MTFAGLFAALVAAAIGTGGAIAQTQPQVHRVGLLSVGADPTDQSPFGAGLIRGFARQGYVVGKNLMLERRAAHGQLDRLPQLVDELDASKVELIVTGGYPAALAAKQRSTLPVVAVQAGDPVEDGLVASFARPGGHVTGLSEVAAELSAKRLALLKEAVPNVHRVAMLWNAEDLGMSLRYKAAEAQARSLGIDVESLGVTAPEGFETAFSAMIKRPPDAILMVSDVLTTLNRKRVFEFAIQHKLPAIYEYDFLVHDGGLMSYGPDVSEMYDRAAGLAARILKGTNPAQLPLETPSRFVLAINLETAKAIGLTIPPSLLARADDVIE
ncbi:MAG TPA: ABC transporter substrate-binding protein [Stellaceae bacterium]|nr:ABC transporter substrate-binding protein [Stellaceae bacterium]